VKQVVQLIHVPTMPIHRQFPLPDGSKLKDPTRPLAFD
jgi:hypothetical protein